MSDDDPFERLGADDDREGDPFDRLGPVDTDESDAPVDAPGETPDPRGPPGEDRLEDPDGEPGPGPSADDPTETRDPSGATDPMDVSPGTDDPFTGVETPDESPFDAGGPSVFQRVDAGAVDPDDVWASITGEDDDEPVELPEEGRYTEVSKHTYCEGCEYFSPPPDVTCTHDTAEIIEFVDMETVRLLDCPVVAERRALERGE